MPSAAITAMTRPPRPNSDPISSTRALIPPSRTAVFRPLKWLCTPESFLHSFHPANDRARPPVPRPSRAEIDSGRQDGCMADDAAVPAATETTSTRGVFTERRDRVAVITVSDPVRRNAMAVDLSEQLVDQVGLAEADEGVGAIVVTGA